MKIAIISDIHDQNNHLEWALHYIATHDIAHIFALGDYCSPYIIEQLHVGTIPIHAVWGNNDADKQHMIQRAHNTVTFAEREFNTIIIEEKTYFITHYPELAEHAAHSRLYNAVFHGHTHHMRNEKIGTTPIINPGKLALYPHNVFSFAIFDTVSNAVSFIQK